MNRSLAVHSFNNHITKNSIHPIQSTESMKTCFDPEVWCWVKRLLYHNVTQLQCELLTSCHGECCRFIFDWNLRVGERATRRRYPINICTERYSKHSHATLGGDGLPKPVAGKSGPVGRSVCRQVQPGHAKLRLRDSGGMRLASRSISAPLTVNVVYTAVPPVNANFFSIIFIVFGYTLMLESIPFIPLQPTLEIALFAG